MKIAKHLAAYILICIVLVLTILALLGIWNIIDLEHVIKKVLLSLFIVFVSSVIILFIFTVIIKDEKKENKIQNTG